MMRQLTDTERAVLLASWPEDFGELYQIALQTMQKVFENPDWKKEFEFEQIGSLAPKLWYTDEGFRRHALALVQITTKIVCALAMPTNRQHESVDDVKQELQYLAKLHVVAMPEFQTKWFGEFLNVMIPTVMSSPGTTSMTDNDKHLAQQLWTTIAEYVANLMSESASDPGPLGPPESHNWSSSKHESRLQAAARKHENTENTAHEENS